MKGLFEKLSEEAGPLRQRTIFSSAGLEIMNRLTVNFVGERTVALIVCANERHTKN